MKILIQSRHNALGIIGGYIPKEVIDKEIRKEMFIKVGLEIEKHIPILQSFETKPINKWVYQTQMIVLSMDTFKNLMNILEIQLPYQEYQKIRDSLNEKI